MIDEFIIELVRKIISGENISFDDAMRISTLGDENLSDIFWGADRIRSHFKKNTIELCAVVNAKSGNCPEDCIFCAQSVWHKVDIDRYPLLSADEVLKCAERASKIGASCFGIVTSGKGIRKKSELEQICKAIRLIRSKIPWIKISVSLGVIKDEFIYQLKEAGIDRFHHNLETSERYFPNICTTHNYKERLDTIKRALQLGIQLCSGGIFGLGETFSDIISLAFTLRELGVESVPLNFLHPIPGTKAQGLKPLQPLKILKVIALFRYILPKADIKICGGRVVNLRQLQCMIFYAGASGMMVGNYLTQAGQEPSLDHKMLEDLNLKVKT